MRRHNHRGPSVRAIAKDQRDALDHVTLRGDDPTGRVGGREAARGLPPVDQSRYTRRPLPGIRTPYSPNRWPWGLLGGCGGTPDDPSDAIVADWLGARPMGPFPLDTHRPDGTGDMHRWTVLTLSARGPLGTPAPGGDDSRRRMWRARAAGAQTTAPSASRPRFSSATGSAQIRRGMACRSRSACPQGHQCPFGTRRSGPVQGR